MAQADWTFLNDGLDIATLDRGVTAGIARPPGGGSFLYAFNSLAAGMAEFIDDNTGINSGSQPLTSGRGGFGVMVKDATRRSFFDHVELLRQP